ncbi:unnamed protein product, partial [Prorocentrum cordatum]
SSSSSYASSSSSLSSGRRARHPEMGGPEFELDPAGWRGVGGTSPARARACRAACPWRALGGGRRRPLSPALAGAVGSSAANDEFDAPRPLAAQALSAAALASAGEPGGGVGEGSRSIGSQGLPAAGAPRRNSPASAGPAAHDAGGGIRSPPCVPPGAYIAAARRPLWGLYTTRLWAGLSSPA